jgi:hypothetical protein
MLSQQQLAVLMRHVFDNEIMALRAAGQAEYAHNPANAFANFERAAGDLGLDRKMILWVFAMKHRDGIASFLKGHVSQREDVRGRINDLIVYLFLLRGMIEDDQPLEAIRALFAKEASLADSPDSPRSDAAGAQARRPDSPPTG